MQIGDTVRYKGRLGVVVRQGGTIQPYWEPEPERLWHVKLVGPQPSYYRGVIATARRFHLV